jgi:hypothetical protein
LKIFNRLKKVAQTVKEIFSLKVSRDGFSLNININGFSILLFSFCFLLHLSYQFLGLTNNLIEYFSFRQTQTAITSFYFIHDGFKIPYLTPVLGSPWTLPFEFPIYQILVGLVVKLTGFSLDLSGRVVSVLFFYFTLYFVYKLSALYLKNKWKPLIILSVLLLHPIYIYWTRTFMIESTALFFTISYCYFILKYHQNKNIYYLLFAFLFSTFSVLVKITTGLPLILFINLYLFIDHFKKSSLISKDFLLKIIVFFISILIGKVWVDYSDSVKSLSAYIYNITSSEKLFHWNFGTFNQKINFDTWNKISINTSVNSKLFYFVVLVSIILAFVKKSKYFLFMLLFFVLYVIYPLIFTNLYFVHNYYSYANSIYFCFLLGLIVLFYIDSKGITKFIGFLFLFTILIFFYGRYKYEYYNIQLHNDKKIISFCEKVKKITPRNEVIMIYGNDWGSEFAYYSERKAVSIRNTFHSTDQPEFKKLLNQNHKYDIKTLIVAKYNHSFYNEKFIDMLLNKYNFKLKLKKDNFFLYRK